MNFSKEPFYEYDEDLDYKDWYIEGYSNISELSQQLESFLNNKKIVIQTILNSSEINISNIPIDYPIRDLGNKIVSLYSHYNNLLNKLRDKKIPSQEKIFQLKLKLVRDPNIPEAQLFKDIKSLCKNLWKELNNLSNLNLCEYPRLIKVAMGISKVLCKVSPEFNLLLTNFYSELQKNYIQLENEFKLLYERKSENKSTTKLIKERVRLSE